VKHHVDSVVRGARCNGWRRALGTFASIIASVLELLVPLVIASGVSTFATEGIASSRSWLPVAGVVIASGAAAAWRALALTMIEAGEMRRLRLGTASTLLAMSPRAVEQFGVGEAVSVYSRTIDQMEPLLSAARIRRRTAAMMIGGCLFLMFWFDWRLASALFGALAVGAAAIGLVLRPVKARAGAALLALGRTAADLNEHLRAVRSATVWGLVTPHLRRLRHDLDDVAAGERQIGRAQAMVDLVVQTTSMVLLIGIGAFGAALVSGGSLSVARLSGFIGALAVLLGPAASYAQAAQAVQRARAAADQLRAVPMPSTTPWVQASGREPLASPVVRAVSARTAPAEGMVTRPVTFTAAVGEMVCLVGPSGSGKTTVLSAIAGMAPLSSGTLTVGGIDVVAHVPEQLWRQIAYVEQATPTLGQTVRDFLTPDPANAPDTEVAARLLADFGLTGRLGAAGLDAPLERGGTSLSGGERQRLAIIRALASDRPLLLLDEPTAHLDGVMEQRVLDAIDRVRADRVVIVASHAEGFARRADRVVWL
jgi:ABC-type multidrug transport system fused ATPase/permease subunit